MENNQLKWFIGATGFAMTLVMILAISNLMRLAFITFTFLFIGAGVWGYFISNDKNLDDETQKIFKKIRFKHPLIKTNLHKIKKCEIESKFLRNRSQKLDDEVAFFIKKDIIFLIF